jgi:hypothetical protein
MRLCLKPLQGGFDKVFRFRARDEHGWTDVELTAEEFLPASDVLSWFTAQALVEIPAEVNPRALRQFVGAVGIKPCPITMQRVRKEYFGREARGRNGTGFEQLDSLEKSALNRHGPGIAPALAEVTRCIEVKPTLNCTRSASCMAEFILMNGASE